MNTRVKKGLTYLGSLALVLGSVFLAQGVGGGRYQLSHSLSLFFLLTFLPRKR